VNRKVEALITHDGAEHRAAVSLPRRPWPFAKVRRLQLALDGAGLAFGIATYIQLADPDLLLHCLWIVLVLEAFAFGFRSAVIRLGIAFSVVVSYAILATLDGPLGFPLADLDLAEWPLMMIIAVVVAIMADRTISLGERSNRRLLNGQQEERRRIALDLHDGVGQTLAALTYTLDALVTSLGSTEKLDAHGEEVLETAKRARRTANLALDETREVAIRLRPLRLAETGLAAAIEELVADSWVPIDVIVDPSLRDPGLLPQATEAEVLRIVQEALGNSIRHSRAEHRWIRMASSTADRIVLSVEDDGIGFDPGQTPGMGLGVHGMMERAASIDGRLEVVSQPGGGTTIRLELRRPARMWGQPSSRRQSMASRP
jgi:signal transduction histidine kinase